jgi:hypothetical protein
LPRTNASKCLLRTNGTILEAKPDILLSIFASIQPLGKEKRDKTIVNRSQSIEERVKSSSSIIPIRREIMPVDDADIAAEGECLIVPGDDDDEAPNNFDSEAVNFVPVEISNGDSSNNTSNSNSNRYRHKTSLAWAPTTPFLASIIIPLLTLATHALFIYGQREPMWRLMRRQHVDVWANATAFDARTFFDTVGLHHDLHFTTDQDQDVKTFTYSYAMTELWRARRMPGKFFPRLAAVLLFIFSGVWPHLKLLILNLTWVVAKHPVRRTRLLHWLSILGKWSLADVLVVCVMVGVLNLDWDVDPTQIKQGFSDQMPVVIHAISSLYSSGEICQHFLNYSCENPHNFNHKLRCSACLNGVETAFHHPGWAGGTGKSILQGIETSGGGSVQLRVVGMRGIYAFCLAVIVSICLSLAVDVFDNRARRALEQEQVDLTSSRSTTATCPDETPGMLSEVDENGSSSSEPLLGGTEQHRLRLPQANGASDDDYFDPSLYVPRYYFSRTRIRLTIASFVVLILVVCAAALPTMERRLNGTIPHLLHDILGVVWTRDYSLSSLVRTTGVAGGWDLLLMATFSLFVVFGPILRSSLCIFGLIVPLPKSVRKTVLHAIDFLGAFCALEVFIVAVFMVDLLMPAITSTIVNKPQCGQIYPGSSCLEVEFAIMWRTFALIFVGGSSLILVANLAQRVGCIGAERELQRRNAGLMSE